MTLLRSALASVAGAVLLATGVPAVAAAQTTELPVVHSARSDFAGDLGTLLVTVTAPPGVDTLHAELVSIATGEEVATTDEFVLQSGTPQDGTWASAQPFLLDELGNYRVHVEVTDAVGNLVRRENAGFLSYQVRTAFQEVVVDPLVVTYEEREVTMSGLLTGRWPGTGEVRPLSGFQIFVSAFFDFDLAVTGPDGGFRSTVTITEAHDFVIAQFRSIPGFLPSGTDFVDIGIDPRPTQIRLQTNPHRVDRGESTRLAGQLKWQTSDGWQPISGVRVGVLFCRDNGNCPTVVGSATTDDEGRFELVHEPFETGHYRVSYRARDPFTGLDDPFVAGASDEAEIAVLQPASFHDFAAVRTGAGRVRLEGHLQFGNVTPLAIPVQLQFSRGGVAGWKTVTTVNAEFENVPGQFFAELDWPTSGYWRAYYPGVRDHLQSAVSQVIAVA